MRYLLPAIILLTVLMALPAGTAQAALPSLSVSGNQLLMGGQPGHLVGVNRSGTEYACIQGWGIFDGPSDAASVQAMAAWHVNSVRVPLNEDCWLGINGVPAAYAGSNYINAIVGYVNLLHQYGIYAELSLIWGAPGTYPATYQSGGPDEDHSPAFWASLATTFKTDPAVILAPWGETITGWTCFMQTGCSDQATYGPKNLGYQTAPMSQAVTVMRQAGYIGPISIPCIDYANQCTDYNGSSWLASHPVDTLTPPQLIAEAHVYGNNACGAQNNGACLQTQYGNLATQVPVLWGETGETYDGSDCGASNMQVLLPWADLHNVSYQAWTWDTWQTCDALIADYAGTPYSGYGQWIKAHYVALAGNPTPSATVTPSPTGSVTPSPTLTSTPTTATPTSTATSTVTATRTPTATLAPGGALVLYDGRVEPPFTDNSFSYSKRTVCDTTLFSVPPCSYQITYQAWGAINFLTPPLDTSPYTNLQYDLAPNGQPITDFSVFLGDSNAGYINELQLTQAQTSPLSTGWLHVTMPLSQLNPQHKIVGQIQLKNWLSKALLSIHVDAVKLI